MKERESEKLWLIPLTIALLVPSVAVTKGEPWPLWVAVHAGVMVGGLVAVMELIGICFCAPRVLCATRVIGRELE